MNGLIHQKGDTALFYCNSAYDGVYVKELTGRLFWCFGSNSDVTIEKVTFKDCKSNDNWFSEYKYTSLNVKNCQFIDCKFVSKLIAASESGDIHKLNFESNIITNCYDYKNKPEKVILYSEYPNNYISQNSITFVDNIDQATRGYYFEKYDRGLIFTGNSIKNGYSSDGAAGIHIEGKDTGISELTFSNCVFTNMNSEVNGEHFATTVFFYRQNCPITFTNVTFEHSKKEYLSSGYGKGYMIQIEPNQDKYLKSEVTFKNCKFSFLEYNGQNGGGIGMFIRKPPNDKYYEKYSFIIRYNDTTFEHLYFFLDSWGGGAISVSNEVDENKYTAIYVNNCTFNNVSSKSTSRGGGAIYYNSPRGTLEVRKSKFINTYPKNSSQYGGAIYIKYESEHMTSNIYDCEFINTRSNKGGAIYIDWNEQLNKDITISGCTFRNTNSYTNSNAIQLEKCYSNVVHINNNQFIDCGTKDSTFTISLDVKNLNFNYNRIIFSDNAKSCGCVTLSTIIKHTFIGNLFQNAKFSTSSAAAGIFYQDFSANSKLNIRNNTFKKIQGNNEGRCIYIKNIPSTASDAIVLSNNTFEDCPEGGNLVKFSFVSVINQYTIESCHFNRNKFNSNLAAQLWINNVNNLIFDDCYFENNMNTARSGGAIRYSNNAISIKILKCHFYGNSAKTSGAAISIETSPNCEINECTFERNACNSGSGSICYHSTNANRNMNILKCVFKDNTANVNGAAIILQGNLVCNINNCNFSENTCKTGSGTIYFDYQETSQSFKINKCNFNVNTAKIDGAAFYIQTASCEVNDCNFTKNTCESGSGTIFCSAQNSCQIINCHFTDNIVQNDGGAININTHDGQISDCTFARNKCNAGSGTIKCRTSNTKINKCDFIENTVQVNGSAIFFYSIYGCQFAECTFVKNTCKAGYGTIRFEIANSDQNIEIYKCEFNESQGQDIHCIDFYNSNSATINIKECNFNDCGNNGCLIRVQSIVQQALLQNCSINFSKDQTAIGIFLNSDKISLIGNTFQHFKNAVVHFPCMSIDEKLEVVENSFIDCSESPIFDIKNYLKTSPTIKGNTFDNINNNYPVLRLKFEDSIDGIVFENNTFSNFNTNNDFGGIGLEIDHENSEVQFNISFNNCYFIHNANTNNQQNGGALSFGPKQNDGNLCLYLFECFFESNQKEGKGSSLFLNIQHEICIESCQFIEKQESEGTIYIEPDCGNDPQQSTIYINDCLFKHNRGGKLSTIYIAPSKSKTVMISSCTFEEDEGGIYLDSIQQNAEFIRNKMFGIKVMPALTIKQYPEYEALVKECIFDSCTADNNKCFDIQIIDSRKYSYSYEFSDNIIQNNAAQGHTSYFGSIICNEKIFTLKVKNISFINNTCDCLYGGGTGIEISGVKSDLFFENCQFVNNSAKQNKEISRPTRSSDKKYYNGDGGAIQLGYICSMNSIDIYFFDCIFKNNQAERHGGAISIQTNRYIEILYCKFENNEANHNFAESSSAELLVQNYFDLKKEGRGGAIYINPSYTYDLDSCNIDHYLQSVKISECEFISNNGYDGYGIYVEGDDVGTTFKITQNIFTNNFNESNHNADVNDIYGAVITTEMDTIEKQKVIDENTFNYSNPDLKVLEISYVDHYGKTQTQAFSNSDAFTQSSVLPSEFFSQSKYFSNSNFFSKSQMFTESNDFSNTDHFSYSEKFTKSKLFSKSEAFLDSSFFSRSQMFSESNDFSNTDHFSNSEKFTKSKLFSKSKAFLDSSFFSGSQMFSESNDFSNTDHFSNSEKFSKSKLFSKSNAFLDSSFFSESQKFSQSLLFSNTKPFSQSDRFTYSCNFSPSETLLYSSESSLIVDDHESSSTDNLISSEESSSEAVESSSEEIVGSSSENIESSSESVESSSEEATESSSEVIESSSEEITESSSEVIESSSESVESSSEEIIESSSENIESSSESVESSSEEITESSSEATESSSSEIIESSSESVESSSEEITESSSEVIESSSENIESSSEEIIESSSENIESSSESVESSSEEITESSSEATESSSSENVESSSEEVIESSFEKATESSEEPVKSSSDITTESQEINTQSSQVITESLSKEDTTFPNQDAVESSIQDHSSRTNEMPTLHTQEPDSLNSNISSTPIPGSSFGSSSKNGKKKSTGLIIGIVFALLALLVIILLVIIFVIRRKKQKSKSENGIDEQSEEMNFNSNVVDASQSEYNNPLYNENYINSNDPFDQAFDESV